MESDDEMRALDALFAEKVLGWKQGGLHGATAWYDLSGANRYLPKYHLSLDAVWPGVERLGASHVSIYTGEDGVNVMVALPEANDEFCGDGSTPAEALMRALLSAKEGE